MPKLTIITINYNHLDGLRKTIDSIVSQTFTDYEWIVVDGGSTDGSYELLEQYKDHFAWWCSEPDKGVYNAMNKGLAQATGEYVNFMNSGDMFANSAILSMVFNENHDADILYGMMARGTVDGELNIPQMMKRNIYWYDFYANTLNHQATFIKRELFTKHGVYDESYKVYADWHKFAQFVAIEKASTKFIAKVIAIYEGGGLSDTFNDEELGRIRKEIYPSMNAADYMQLKNLEIIGRFKISRAIYNLMCKINRKIYDYCTKHHIFI